MKKFVKVIIIILVFVVSSCSTEDKKQNDTTAKTEEPTNEDTIASEPIETVEARVPPQFQALKEAYPDNIVELKDNYIILRSGEKIIYDDGKEKDFIGRLEDSDVEDMFYDVYALPNPEPAFQFDPGRSRSEALYKAMYGNSASAVQKNLTNVEWLGQQVTFTSINGAADSLRAVAKEIAHYPELKLYLKSSGTFYWRPVRGAERMSAHSYGIAFDIGVEKSDYWQWKSGSNDENKKVAYSNQIPRQLVEIFQKHGFIWGGAWYHFDTMHFEFRPELLRYKELVEKSRK